MSDTKMRERFRMWSVFILGLLILSLEKETGCLNLKSQGYASHQNFSLLHSNPLFKPVFGLI